MPQLLLPEMSQPVSIIFGVFLIVIGFSFAYKGYQALIKGRLLIWRGFLPFTLISPFVNHLPPGKNSLLQYKEAMWIHVIMGPMFLILFVLCVCAGLDYTGLPGTKFLNDAMTGGKLGVAPAVTFNPRRGYTFPIIPRNLALLGKALSGKIGLSKKDQLYEEKGGGSQTLDDAAK